MNVEMVYTPVFEAAQPYLMDSPSVRFLLLQGGSRSSKSYSLCQLLIVYCLYHPGKVVSIVRKTFPALRASVMRDFFEILKDLNLYNIKAHNRSEHIYTFPNGSQVEFFSVDDEQKVRGRKRHVCWINEANEAWKEDYQQLNLRTEEMMIFDFNPSFTNGWLYELAARDNSVLQKSTFRMNPFLSKAQVDELEFLKHTDPDAYRVYNLGERAQTQEHVLRHWIKGEKPEDLTECAYGLDFGWNHPNALVRVWHDGSGKRFHLEEVSGGSNQTIEALIEVMNQEVNKEHYVLADGARPDLINTIQEAGFNCFGADKAVNKGLTILRTSILTVEPTSTNLISNLESYRHKKVRGVLTDEVVKLDDDYCDATRYACTFLRSISGGLSFSSMEM